jgi:molecular chaperone GrpE (heat shock protein)
MYLYIRNKHTHKPQKTQTMNYIHQLQNEIAELKEQNNQIEAELLNYVIYFRSEKFQGFENDYAHVSTDLLPKMELLLRKIRLMGE